MAAVAYTEIRHGKDDGSEVVILEGEEVKGLPKEVVQNLTEQGLIGDPPRTQAERDADKEALQAEVSDLEDENQSLTAQVAELQRKLAEATKDAGK